MTQKNVLICGASGFIGRNLFDFIGSKKDSKVFGIFLKNQLIIQPNMFKVDLRIKENALAATRGMDIVINAAAMTDGIGVFSDENKMTGYASDNDLINKNLIESACINEVSNFVFLSCTVMYPSSLIPLKESEADIANVHPKYTIPGKMKLRGEDWCRDFSSQGKTKYTIVRHTNIYGPHDKFDLKRGHVLAATVRKVIEADNQITVWGSGNESRDFLYITDLIKFIEIAIEKQQNPVDIFNVGYGKTHSINELIGTIIASSGKKIEVLHDLSQPSVDSHMSIDVSKSEQILGWRASIDLKDGITQTYDWYRRNQ